MKNNRFSKLWIFALCISVSIISSCQKALDINIDPNQAPTATPALVLPASQVGMAIAIGSWNRTGMMWGQYWTGGQGVSSNNLEKYSMTGTDVETSWNQAYSKSLADMDFLVRSGQPIYAGMGKIMQAYLYQTLADLFGAIPFTEALKGAPEDGSILAPKFDDPAVTIYPALINMIDSGIANVQTTGDLVAEPGSDDLMFGGDIDQWVAFANTVKLKIYVRQGDFTSALALMNSGVDFLDASTSAQVNFTESARNANPMYTYFESSGLNMYYLGASASILKLQDLDDPRLGKLYTTATAGPNAGSFVGVNSGEVNIDPQYALIPGESAPDGRKRFSNIGAAVYNYNIPIYFVSGWESKFLQAEVLIRNGQDGSTALAEGIQASFDVLGAGDASAYTASLGFNSGDPIDDQINILAVQKWISMNGLQMAEGWLETVRFDRTGNKIFSQVGGIFTDPSQNTLGARNYPSSFVYPTQEVANNPNTPAGRVVIDKRFWDN